METRNRMATLNCMCACKEVCTNRQRHIVKVVLLIHVSVCYLPGLSEVVVHPHTQVVTFFVPVQLTLHEGEVVGKE